VGLIETRFTPVRQSPCRLPRERKRWFCRRFVILMGWFLQPAHEIFRLVRANLFVARSPTGATASEKLSPKFIPSAALQSGRGESSTTQPDAVGVGLPVPGQAAAATAGRRGGCSPGCTSELVRLG
jgi:hypothetical protein